MSSPAKAASPKKRATPKKAGGAKKTASHPTYAQMTKMAIQNLKDRKGSSKAAILKYILQHYKVGDNIKMINAHLRTALKRGVTSGKLKQVKGAGASGSFRLADGAAKKTGEKKKRVTKKKTTAAKPKGEKKAKKSPKKKASPKKAKKPAAKKPKSPKKVKTPKKKTPKKAKKTPSKK